MSMMRTRWAAIGAAVAVTLGAGGIGLVDAARSSGERNVYTAIESCRLIDTRPAFAVGPRTSPLGPGEILTLLTHGSNGQCTGIPSDANALGLNVTALGATQATHLTFFIGSTVPNSSSLNPAPGQPPTPNAVTVKLAGDGSFKVFNNSGSVHLIIDIVGYYQDHNHDNEYAPAATSQFRWAGCNGPSMNAGDDAYDTYIITTDTRGFIGSSTHGTRLWCHLDLPQGATVSQFRALLRDIGPTGSGQGLARCWPMRMALTGPDAGDEIVLPGAGATTGLLGSNGSETPFLVTDGFPSVTIDNDNYVYFIKCDLWAGGSTAVSQLGIYMAQVRYNVKIIAGTG